VEEMAAAASSLKTQAQELVNVVAVFKLDEGNTRITLPAPEENLHLLTLPSKTTLLAAPHKVDWKNH
jgi:methyl-accepting chemotaxis protein